MSKSQIERTTEMVDLDAFLTQIESKLRAPFTSMELAKAVTISASHGSDSSLKYLSHILEVLPRAEKVTQLRTLIGLLGVEPSEDTNIEIEQILEAAQEAPIYDEWVRVIAGLVHGMLFRMSAELDSHLSSNDEWPSSSLNEAQKLLHKTCGNIIDRVWKVETVTRQHKDDYVLFQSDANPLFAPYHFHLLSPNTIQSILPESLSHNHFQINKSAEILQIDAKIEMDKAIEEQEHRNIFSSAPDGKTIPPTADAVRKGNNDFLQNPAAGKPTASVSRPKSSSMFMPSKPNIATNRVLGGAGQKKTVTKPGLHQRKAGAAQSLLAKGRQRRMIQTGHSQGPSNGTGASTSPKAPIGRSSLTGISTVRGMHKSKMKMIDVTEVQGLESKKQQDVNAAQSLPKSRKAQTQSGKKRINPEPLLNNAANDIITTDSKEKRHFTNDSPATLVNSPAPEVQKDNTNAGELASAALLAYQSQKVGTNTGESAGTEMNINEGSAGNKVKQLDWRQMLELRSNRLSEADRQRIHQFFVDRINPTPGETKFKIKLHEERMIEATTGKPVKETYFLELDYESHTMKQTKKVKKYQEGH